MKKLREKKIEFDDKAKRQLKCLEDKVIEQVAQALIFVAREVFQKERESNIPSKSSVFLNFKIETYERNRNR